MNSKKQTGLLRLYKAEGTRESSRLECCPAFGQTILGIGTNRSAFIFRVKSYKKQLFYPADEGTTILRNIRHHSQNTTAQHNSRLHSSAAPMCQSPTSQDKPARLLHTTWLPDFPTHIILRYLNVVEKHSIQRVQ